MATEAQKRARQNFVNRFAYGLGRGVARARQEGGKLRSKSSKNRRIGIYPGSRPKVGKNEKAAAPALRKTIAFFVGLGEGISRRKKQQLEAARKAAARAKK